MTLLYPHYIPEYTIAAWWFGTCFSSIHLGISSYQLTNSYFSQFTQMWWYMVLVGALEHFSFFHSVGNNHPNWLIFFSGVLSTTNQSWDLLGLQYPYTPCMLYYSLFTYKTGWCLRQMLGFIFHTWSIWAIGIMRNIRKLECTGISHEKSEIPGQMMIHFFPEILALYWLCSCFGAQLCDAEKYNVRPKKDS